MKIEFIYTFEKMVQQILVCDCTFENLKDEKTLAKFATTKFLTSSEKRQLVKISCCVYFEQNESRLDTPQWYNDANGKLWFENGKLIKNEAPEDPYDYPGTF